MYQGNAMTLDTLVDRASALKNAAHDFMLDSRHLEMVVDRGKHAHMQLSVLDPGGERHGPYKMTDTAVRQLCTRLDPKVPVGFLNDLMDAPHGQLLAQAIVAQLSQAKPSRQLVRCLDSAPGFNHDPLCRAFMSSSYRVLDNADLILRSLQPAMQDRPDLEIKSGYVDIDKMFVKIVSDQLKAEIVPGGGDDVFAGVRIENSETGLSALTATPFVYRLVCKNGMTSPLHKGLRQIHLGGRDKGDEAVRHYYSDKTLRVEAASTFLKFQDVIGAALSPKGFSEIVDTMRRASGERYENEPEVVVDALQDILKFTDAERMRIVGLAHIEPKTRWGLCNAVTGAANSADNYERATALEDAGGSVLTLNASQWRNVSEATSQYTKTLRLN